MYGHPVITRNGRWHDCVYSIGTFTVSSSSRNVAECRQLRAYRHMLNARFLYKLHVYSNVSPINVFLICHNFFFK